LPILEPLERIEGQPKTCLATRQFHLEHGVVYDSSSKNNGLGVQTFLKTQAARQSVDFIREPNPESLPKSQAPRGVPQPSDATRFQSADEILAEVLRSLPIRRLPKAEYQNRDEGVQEARRQWLKNRIKSPFVIDLVWENIFERFWSWMAQARL
jgi:hypothetical protein